MFHNLFQSTLAFKKFTYVYSHFYNNIVVNLWIFITFPRYDNLAEKYWLWVECKQYMLFFVLFCIENQSHCLLGHVIDRVVKLLVLASTWNRTVEPKVSFIRLEIRSLHTHNQMYVVWGQTHPTERIAETIKALLNMGLYDWFS